MKNDSQSPVRRKPAGGVRFVTVTPAANVREAEFSEEGGRCTYIEHVDESAVMQCRLLEERSSFTETLAVDGGAVAVTHRLTLVADRNTAAAWLEPDFAEELVCRGAVAEVTLADGRRLAVGLSPKFKLEQPLRLRSLTADSGRSLTDEPTVTMVLESSDNAFAAEF